MIRPGNYYKNFTISVIFKVLNYDFFIIESSLEYRMYFFIFYFKIFANKCPAIYFCINDYDVE